MNGTDIHVGRFVVTTYRYGMVVITTADRNHEVALLGDQANSFRADLDTAYERHMPTAAFPTVRDLIDSMCGDYEDIMEERPAA